MTAHGQVERSAVYEAITKLNGYGYFAERVSGLPKYFDIVAWRRGRTLCITVRSSRHAKLSAFRDYLQAVSKMVGVGSVPGEVQFWIYRTPGWSMYLITSGGAVPTHEWEISPEAEAAVV